MKQKKLKTFKKRITKQDYEKLGGVMNNTLFKIVNSFGNATYYRLV